MNYKFNEGQLIQELQAYIDGTYDQHMLPISIKQQTSSLIQDMVKVYSW